ncbi:MAG: HEPN domain-containing protein [DPANN group archaeon]|nr:HEPN domain-containing protein [DPANN group archaeon]
MTRQKLREFEDRGLCGKTPFIKRVAPHFMEKARHNLLFSDAARGLSNKEDAKKILGLPEDFSAFDWVVITAYYAMYHSALAALASIGYKSDNHTATIIALEVFFVRKKLLEKEFLEKLKQARELEEEYVQKLRYARRQRETAQYGVTEETGKDAAERLLKNAGAFVNRMETLIQHIAKTTL